MLFNLQFKDWHHFQQVTKKSKFTVSRPKLVKQCSAPVFEDIQSRIPCLTLTKSPNLIRLKTKRDWQTQRTPQVESHGNSVVKSEGPSLPLRTFATHNLFNSEMLHFNKILWRKFLLYPTNYNRKLKGHQSLCGLLNQSKHTSTAFSLVLRWKAHNY